MGEGDEKTLDWWIFHVVWSMEWWAFGLYLTVHPLKYLAVNVGPLTLHIGEDIWS